jgi:hypothetical protein
MTLTLYPSPFSCFFGDGCGEKKQSVFVMRSKRAPKFVRPWLLSYLPGGTQVTVMLCPCLRVRTAPGNSWKVLEFDFQVFQALETPGNRLVSWKAPGNFYKVLLEFSRLSNVHTFALKFMQSRMNDHFSRFLLFGRAFSKLDHYCITRYTIPANFSRGSDTLLRYL